MNEREYLAMVSERSNVLFAPVIRKCIEECLYAISDEEFYINKKLNWRDFLYNGKKVIVKNRILFIGSDILGKAHKRLYSPRPDLAFAPFNLNPDTVSIASELYECIERECWKIKMFVNKLKESCRKNALNYKRDLMEFRELLYIWLTNTHSRSLDPVEVIGKVDHVSKNPRSFIALEVCFTGSMKHTLGSLVNASILGYYGVIITNTSMLERALRLKYYILSVPVLKDEKSVIGKNVLIVTYEQFIEAMEQAFSIN